MKKYICLMEKHYKILLLGDSGVGKTAIFERIINDRFNPSYMTTIGVDYGSKYFDYNEEKIKISLWDTAGQERFRAITRAYIRGADAMLIVFDLTDRESFDAISHWMHIADDNIKKCDFILVGNKSDLKRTVEEADVNTLINKYSLPYFEVSAKETLGFENLTKCIVETMAKRPYFPIVKKEKPRTTTCC